jgi:hypothetical protein
MDTDIDTGIRTGTDIEVLGIHMRGWDMGKGMDIGIGIRIRIDTGTRTDSYKCQASDIRMGRGTDIHIDTGIDTGIRTGTGTSKEH